VGRVVPKDSFHQVVKIIDGDTVVLENGQHLRYIGIDTPEINWQDIPHSDCYGWQARKANQKLVLGRRVRLKRDISNTDKYGRLLRYVYVGNLFVNDYLVKHGYARLLTIPPDVRYAKMFKKSQREAKDNRRGLWGLAACQK